jgi:hypothetical protein
MAIEGTTVDGGTVSAVGRVEAGADAGWHAIDKPDQLTGRVAPLPTGVTTAHPIAASDVPSLPGDRPLIIILARIVAASLRPQGKAGDSTLAKATASLRNRRQHSIFLHRQLDILRA